MTNDRDVMPNAFILYLLFMVTMFSCIFIVIFSLGFVPLLRFLFLQLIKEI